MLINVGQGGEVQCIYTDKIDLHQIGTLDVRRVSNIEYDYVKQGWMVTIYGTVKFGVVMMGPFKNRTEAKKAEIERIEREML